MCPKRSFYEEQFHFGALIPERWVTQAHRLKDSADLLYAAYLDDLRRFGKTQNISSLKNLTHVIPATFLYGLAIENLLKAILMKNEPDRVSEGKLRKWPSGGHDLIALATTSRIELTAEERDLLQRLTHFIRWAGRYPIPMKLDDMELVQISMPEGFLAMPLQQAELSMYENLFTNLESMSS
jgi:hypothetical protein